MNLESIYQQAKAIIDSNETVDARLLHICKLLNESLENYDWVGFYLVDPNEDRMLYLGPYVGAPTDHTRIPFGTGICGQAAETLETFVVPDVSKATNYLACSLTVKSEIVVPIMHGDLFLGELDIDSHVLDNFGDDHRILLERICVDLAPVLA
jgi:L-methionine (R)-S-oxide reductase